MEPDTQPESDSVASWRAGMSPSSSLLLALHGCGGVTEVDMQLNIIDGAMLAGRNASPEPAAGHGCWLGRVDV